MSKHGLKSKGIEVRTAVMAYPFEEICGKDLVIMRGILYYTLDDMLEIAYYTIHIGYAIP